MDAGIDVAIIGGSGLYELAPVVDRVGPVAICEVQGRRVAFLNRHGDGHRVPPHAVDYRANLRALADLGARRILATFACGSLTADLGPGTLVVPDQLIDRTRGRADTFFDAFHDGLRHAEFAEPYDAAARQALLTGTPDAVDGGTVVVINGPRFATRAESRWYRSMGGTLINMTQYPEAVLARELHIPYAAIGLITDYDSGVDDRPDIAPVTIEAVLAEFERHLPRLRAAVLAAAVL
ncbi:MAG: 5'-methylthioadenosine phosphorylase [uncultured Acidimicrobiales bacterium]|uniref:Purine nucleoside phosphorylase n=1 Tax=uncultured Acidimicrobiales bacterium TaxID=310071 RepID=A0A6J4I747_9ACTN|nr:MAG: 5'-methylthioadenosine phosphorylase [uncultured Acidimicrobiales bacterium]